MTLGNNDLHARIRSFLSDSLLSPEAVAALGPDTQLITGGVLSSIVVLSLVAFLEDELSIELEAYEISPEYMNTLDGIVELCLGKIAS